MRREARIQEKVSPRHEPAEVVCEVCGKSEDRCFEVHLGGERHVFDSFECAGRAMLPSCPLCGRLLLGPGVQMSDGVYCSAACAGLYDTQEI
jgi:hypothetical protein